MPIPPQPQPAPEPTPRKATCIVCTLPLPPAIAKTYWSYQVWGFPLCSSLCLDTWQGWDDRQRIIAIVGEGRADYYIRVMSHCDGVDWSLFHV